MTGNDVRTHRPKRAPMRGRNHARRGRAMWGAGVALVALLSAAGVARAAPALMPYPASVRFDAGSLSIPEGVSVTWEGARTPMLERAVGRFRARLAALGGIPAPAADAPAATQLHIHVGADPAYLSVAAREGYRLTVDVHGIDLAADGPAGVLHGLATLLQLVRAGPQSPAIAFARIDDAPRFAWRGVMIDVARHFMTIETLKRQIDAMELVKLDVLHLHLSDGQGFRVESRVFPRLTTVASHGQYYTQEQIRDLVAYAADRGIRIVPEFDTPGHAFALLLAYPDLASQPPAPGDRHQVNVAAIDPTLEGSYRFLRRLYGEMGHLFPDPYFHAGGDEVSATQWTKNAAIAAFMRQNGFATPQQLQAAFTARIQKILHDQGKIMMGWDEITEAAIPGNVVIEAWRGSKFIASATRAGHPVVVSAGYYLDLLQPASEHYLVDPLDPQANGLTPELAEKLRPKLGAMVDALKLDPSATMSPAQDRLVMGGEAPLWTEVVTDEMLDARLWPRSAAIAERFWSPASVRDVPDMYRRLAVVQDELCVTGLQAQANRYRMAARLSPGNAGPVLTLADATSPIRHYGHNHPVSHGPNGPVVQQMNTPSDIAAPDSAGAERFNDLARRYVAGDRSVRPVLEAMLTRWRDNDAAFQAVSAGRPILEDARPASQELKALAQAGLDALAGRNGKDWRAVTGALLARQDQAVAASANMVVSHTVAQPPADLLQDITPGVRTLAGLD
ncbi:beta-N-acetylhexosaminidase [Gluconacetobacter johannae DSM 13595]|nr:family 20 glycosylhydrolase [Gluconacetobacter johannae]GBQ85817.1 beta-N-acetylhexosaminidase [Gluconacetobacter johannae DSM 13595]